MLNRRTVLSASLAGAAGLVMPQITGDGLALPFCSAAVPQASPRPRCRLEDFVTATDEIEAFMRGVSVMKSRQPSDPTSWFFQAAIHGVAAADLAAAMARDRGVTPQLVEAFWRKCPHRDADLSADFLVWHRAYLYHFERILRAASGDPGFSLPYWNYLDKDQRRFPDLFAFPALDPQGRARNPLYEQRRDPLTSRLGIDYEINVDGPPSLDPFLPGAMFGQVSATAFGGAMAPESSGSGYLEGGLHDTVHRVIGGEHGLMSDSDTAAFDPVFWVHHTSVDRIWTTFDCLPRKQWGDAPQASWLLAAPWLFYDGVTGTVRREPRGFYLHRGNLDVRYDTDDPACRPLSERPPTPASGVAVLGGGARARLRSTAAMNGMPGMHDMAAPGEATAPPAPPSSTLTAGSGAAGPRLALAADRPTLASVAVARSPLGPTGLAAALSRRADAPARRVYLEVAGLALTRLPNVRYRLFVNLPGNQPTAADAGAYVGTLAIFGVFRGGDGPGDTARLTVHGEHRTTQRFDITAQVARLADPKAVRVTVVPESLLKPIGGPPLPSQGDLSIGGFTIVVD